jgi:hypothetical protein
LRQNPNGVHDFNAGNRTPGGPKGFEAEHRPREPFHGAMVLLDDIIEVFTAPNDNGRLVRALSQTFKSILYVGREK